jgi:cytochrome c biogenesis protein CcdA
MSLSQLASNWYALQNTLFAATSTPLGDLAYGVPIPLLSAVLFGLIGATAPCQLTTSASALAYVARQAATTGGRGSVAASALAYVAGKVLVYTVLGLAVIVLGRQIIPTSAIVIVRKILGPAMLLLGLYLLGVLPLRFSVGQGVLGWIEHRAGGGAAGAFVLGTAFSFAFCPTLFLLFFGLTIPMALASPVGAAYPGLFALRTSLPLLVLAALVTVGIGAMQRTVASTRRAVAWLQPAAGVVLILAGLSDTLTYWLL